ncbi:hypothetical protein AMJ85_09910 [candidate division BRC1 bacterium SM23_51]|nr:MAG: hypothetical protein AMJ85_09910 [candidate division BRC1 bacterium SM23_51]
MEIWGAVRLERRWRGSPRISARTRLRQARFVRPKRQENNQACVLLLCERKFVFLLQLHVQREYRTLA